MSAKNRQSGATLVTALIMLVVLTLLVVSAMRSSNTNLRIVGNMQAQEEAVAAGQQAIEAVLSSNFTVNPVSSVTAIDANNETYTVTVDTPTCIGSAPLDNEDLSVTNPADAACFASGAAPQSIFFISASSAVTAPPGPSWCSAQRWDVQAQVSSDAGADATIHQGTFLRVKVGTPCT